MISSDTKILLRRSGVPGRVPTTADLKLGELGVNYYDGKIFLRQQNDVVGDRIIEPGQAYVVGRTIFVTVNGNDNNSGLNVRDSKRTIKAAAAIAEPGDGIKVYPGQYIEDNPIIFKDRVSVEGMELRNVLVTPANPAEDLYLVGDGFHATNHSFVSNQDSTDGAAIISFRRLEGTASDRYFDAARLIRDNLDFIASETVGFLTSGFSGFAAGHRSQDGARSIDLNSKFITEEAFQYINSPDYQGPNYFNPDLNQCRRDLGNVLEGWRYDLISDGNSETTGVGLTYYAPIKFFNSANVTDLVYDNTNGTVIIETDIDTQVLPGDEIKLRDIRLDCGPYGNDFIISNFAYDNKSGVGTISLPFIHDITPGQTIKLDGLEFDCPPYGAKSFDVVDFNYDETTGNSIVKVSSPHGLDVGEQIELRDLQFDCPPYGGTFANIIDLDYNNVSGRGVLTFDSSVDLASGDTVTLFDIRMTCPAYGNDISVTDFTYDNFTGSAEVEVADPHGLVPGDLFKLEDLKFSCDSYLNETFDIIGFNYNNLTGEAVATLSQAHNFTTAEDVKLDGLVFECNSYQPAHKPVTGFEYDNASGIATITLQQPSTLTVGETFRLENLAFACNSYSFSDIDVNSAFYQETTGFLTLSLAENHGQNVGEFIRITDLLFSCGLGTEVYPTDPTVEYEILDVPTPSQMIINVGVSTLQHSYVSGGQATVGITTTIFPDGTQGFQFTTLDTPNQFTVVTNVGVSTIAHSYVGGGNLFVGFTTTVFPDGTQGDTFEIISIPAANQIGLNVGISSIAHNYVAGGTAQSLDSFINITGLNYNNVDGTGVVTLDQPHGLFVGDSFVMEDVTFNCDSYRNTATRLPITDVLYDNVSGIATISLGANHNLDANDTIALYGIEFLCNSGVSVYPDGTVPNFYDVLSAPSPVTIVTNVGVSTIAHTYDGGGELQVGITTNVFPDGTRPSDNIFDVVSIPAPNQILTNIGVSSIAHTYASGGKFYTGITTNIFPSTYTDPTVNVVNAVYDNVSGEVVITTDKPHGLTASAPVLLQFLEFECNSGGPGGSSGMLVFPRNNQIYTVQSVNNPSEYVVNVGPSAFAHTYKQGGISIPQNILDAVYDNTSGELTVTTAKQHGFKRGDKASVIGLNFSCSQGAKLYPEPNDLFTVTDVTGTDITVNVGAFPSVIHTYLGGGSIELSGTTLPVQVALYNQDTGDLRLTTTTPLGASTGDTVRIQGLQFSCDAGVKVYPDLDVPYFPVINVVDADTYVLQLETSTFVHTYTGGGFSTLQKRADQNNIFKVLSVLSPTKVLTDVGSNDIAHDYVSGGNLFVGITTNIFPDGTRPEGSRFEVLSRLSPNQAIVNIGVSTIPHFYESGGRIQYGETNEREVIAADYNNQTGALAITVRGNHDLSVGQDVKLQGLEFACTTGTTIYPDGTGASINIFPVTEIINANQFITNVGAVPAIDHDYITGGSVFVGVTTNIFPDGTIGYDFTVNNVVSSTEVAVNVGISSIQHNYVRGGQLFAGRTNERDILDFQYDNVSGDAILTFRQPEENLFTGDLVKLQNLRFDCSNSTGITTNIFPDGSQGNLFEVTQRLNSTQFQLKIGSSTIEHTYVRGTGEAFVGITTNIFPDVGTLPGQQPSKLFRVLGIPAPNQVTAEIGISSITHNYKGGGRLSIGINTDIFPGDPVVSPLGDIYTVDAITIEGELVINVGVSTIEHFYENGGQVLYGQSAGGQLQHITGPGVKEATIAAIDFERQISKSVVNNRPWGSFIVGETSVVDMVEYDNLSGFATITARGINAFRGDTIRLSDLQFRCSDEYAGLTTTFFPDNTRPGGQYFEVESRVGIDTFETFIGVSTIRHEYSRGGNAYRYHQNVTDLIYDAQSGIAEVRSFGHGFKANDIVELGDLRFSCPVFTPDYDIENFQYNNLTGISTITTTVDNDIEVGDLVKLDDIKFECPPYGNAIGIQSFFYENTTGVSTVFTEVPHGVRLNARSPIGVETASYDNVTGLLRVETISDINLNDIKNGVLLAGLGFTCSGISSAIEIYPPDPTVIYDVVDVESARIFSAQVGVSTIEHIYEGGGTATKVDRSDIRLADLKFDCPPYGNTIDVSNFLYDNVSGNSLITLVQPHGLAVGDDIKLADLKFQCLPYDNDFDVIGANYDNVSGIITVSVNRPLGGISIGDKIRVKDLQFDCINSGPTYTLGPPLPDGAGQGSFVNYFYVPTSQSATPPADLGDNVKLSGLTVFDIFSGNEFSYPDGRDASLNIFEVVETTIQTTIGQPNPISVWRIAVFMPLLTERPIQFRTDAFGSYGELTVGITTNIYPENVGAEGGIYEVISLPSENEFAIQAGVSSIVHNYVRNGEVFTGVTTNFFPDPNNTQNSPLGNIFPVVDVPTPTQLRINVGTSTITHVYESGGQLFTGITTNIFPDGTQGDLFPVVSVASSTELRVNVGTSTIPHIYQSGGELFTGITTNIFPSPDPQNSPGGFIYEVIAKDEDCPDRFQVNVGISSIQHKYLEGGTVTTGVTTDKFPDGTNGFEFPVLNVIDENNFTVNVGPSSISHTYVDGGFTRRVESPIQSFVYNNETGISTVGVTSHRLNIGDLVKLRDIKFDCDPYGNEKFITGAQYNNATGRFSVITSTPHGLSINDTIKLSDIQMDCDAYNNTIGIETATYNSITGVLEVTTVSPFGFSIGQNIKLDGLEFSCISGISTYPDGDDASINIYPVTSAPTSTRFTVNVGVSTLSHQYVGGGNVFVGITTNIFPSDAQNSPRGSFLRVIDTPSNTEFTVDVGVSSITHRYVRNGIVQSGITTDVFPDGTQGDFFVVTDVLDDNTFETNTGVSSIRHRYNSGGSVSKFATYQSKFPQVLDDGLIRVSGDCQAVGARIDQLAGIVTSILDNGPEAAPGGISVNVTSAAYNNNNGDLSVTVDKNVDLAVGNIISIQDLLFECDRNATVTDALYNNQSGRLRVQANVAHQFSPGDRVRLEGLNFSCVQGSKVYPEDSTVFYTIAGVIDDFSFEVQLDPTELSHAYEGGGIIDGGSGIKKYPNNNVTRYPVQSILSGNTFVINVGASDIIHSYVSGGTVDVGLRFDIIDANYNNVTGTLEVETDKQNNFVANTGVRLIGMNWQCSQGAKIYPEGLPATVVASTYNNVTGKLSVTTNVPHQLFRDAKVKLQGLQFACSQGVETYPKDPNKLLRVLNVEDDFTYEVQLDPSTFVHTYQGGGTSDPGLNNFRISKILSPTKFTVDLAPSQFAHTYVSGGTATAAFTEQELFGINLRTQKCADDVKKIYLAVVHDVTRGGNWKSIDAGKRYYDALGQIQFIAGSEIDQTITALDFSINIVRNVINNTSWGYVPRGYLRSFEKKTLALPKSTKTSVISFQQPLDVGQFTTSQKEVENFAYNNITGVATVTTTLSHGMEKYAGIKLDGLEFRCNNSPRITTNIFPDGTQGEIFEVIEVLDNTPIEDVGNVVYDNETGLMTITTLDPTNLPVGTRINVRNLRFSCIVSGQLSNKLYPENPNYTYEVLERPSATEVVINAGISTIEHSYNPISVPLPDTPLPQIQELSTAFTTHVGTVAFNHTYVQGGTVWRSAPFTPPTLYSQVRDVSIQDDPTQLTNSTPAACQNVMFAIDNAVGVVTTIIGVGFDASGIVPSFPGNDGKGVPTMDEMSSQGVGNIIKGPYIRNCTNFVPKSIGMRMDGFDAEPGDEISNGVQGSSNVDSFTQFNPGGIGCSISNGTYQQLVSIFTICCDEAIVCDSGAQLDLTNSNSSFGRLGLVARGIGDARSKCIDRYTGVVAETALIEDDTVSIAGLGEKRPYDGQGIFFGELFREVISIKVTDGGSGYDDDNPPNATVAEPTGPSGIKAEISPTVVDGVIVSIEVIASGNQYRERNPVVTIPPPRAEDGRQAKAIAITEPLYYDVDTATKPEEGVSTIVFKQRLNNTVGAGTTVFFSRLSLQIASSHSFEYIGSGNTIDGARPSQGGVPIKENEVVKEDGGQIVYTSTDQAGNFNIGDDLVINQFTGTVTGRSFDQSVLNKVTPLIIALDS